MGNMENMTATQLNTSRESESMFRAQPLPDISQWSNGFRGWGILNKARDSKSNSSDLGIFIAESGIAENRIFGWAALFILIAAISGFLFIIKYRDSPALTIIALVFLAAAIYRFAIWFLNKDLEIKIFREGFILRKAGQEHTVHWQDIEFVKEQWQKTVHEGIIHIYRHKIEIYGKNGTKLDLDRSFEKIEEMGRWIQLAVADFLLPAHMERLQNNEDCDFGAFTINRFGIRHKGNFLPWEQVKSIDVHSVGQTTLKVQELNASKWSIAWATENGGAVKNLTLFLNLSYWFINSARQSVTESTSPSNTSQKNEVSDIYYRLVVTKKEAQEGTQKIFWVGTPRQERELIVKIPAGTQTGTVYRFPDYGRTNADNGRAGTLITEVLVETLTPLQMRLQRIQMFAGILILVGGMIWLMIGSSLDLLGSILVAGMIGALGGYLISIHDRLAGLIAGAIGGAICFILQFIYLLFMYMMFGRESFWNYEMVLVLFICALPGYGIYKLLLKNSMKRQMKLS